MFSFFFKIIVSILIIFTTYYFFQKKEINILEIIVLLFLFQIISYSLYTNQSLLITILSCILIITIYYLYNFLYQKEVNEKLNKIDKVFINRGIINFSELIKDNYSYDNLLMNLKKRGINNPSDVDYCIKKDNDLIIFKKNTVKNYPISIIIDGNILKDNLFSIKKNLEWLNHKLEENNLTLDKINYAYYKNKEVYFVTN